MSKIITTCPSCNSFNINVVKIECESCHTKFEGKFEIPTLLRLNQEDLSFILNFVKCSGSLKDMASQQKISYPTLRNRLNQLIEMIEKLELKTTLEREDVLQLLENGTITAQEAARMLYKL